MSRRSVPPSSRLSELAARFSAKRVLVVGDLIADEFVYGEIARVSREAPVMILRYESTVTVPGGAGNAAANAAALGGRAALAGLVGRDRPGRQAVKALVDRGVDVGGLAGERHRATPTKTRLLAGLVHSLRQQVIRIDNEPRSEPSTDALDRVAATVRERAATTDAIVLSDYN
ncbi:MAG TPA: PfkB family carbohydrate kinase, partial [Blastocatellia bacterium]|nr:PfkB family carbohydrate kinase [Blastocatellia bacterium]